MAEKNKQRSKTWAKSLYYASHWLSEIRSASVRTNQPGFKSSPVWADCSITGHLVSSSVIGSRAIHSLITLINISWASVYYMWNCAGHGRCNKKQETTVPICIESECQELVRHISKHSSACEQPRDGSACQDQGGQRRTGTPYKLNALHQEASSLFVSSRWPFWIWWRGEGNPSWTSYDRINNLEPPNAPE